MLGHTTGRCDRKISGGQNVRQSDCKNGTKDYMTVHQQTKQKIMIN